MGDWNTDQPLEGGDTAACGESEKVFSIAVFTLKEVGTREGRVMRTSVL